ncbi:hypothetical protein H0X48_00315 [Candidatus Dependentiae bacterium]|nr:hypothetical protein [Candidatus Dependentiae bacterium]
MPLHGTAQDRVTLTKLLNSILKRECTKNNIAMLDVYNFYALPDGTLNPRLSDSCMHINMLCNYHIRQALVRIARS